jgi:hypothetical protein
VSWAFVALQIFIAVAFLVLLAVQEICRAIGSAESIKIWHRAEPHLYWFGILYFAIILWKFVQLAS